MISVSGKKWEQNKVDKNLVEKLKQDLEKTKTDLEKLKTDLQKDKGKSKK